MFRALTRRGFLGVTGAAAASLGFPTLEGIKRGDFGAASLYPGKYAAHDGREASLRDTAFPFERPS